MCDPRQIIIEFPLPEWIEEALKARSKLHKVDIADYALEIFTAHFERRVFDATNITKQGDS